MSRPKGSKNRPKGAVAEAVAEPIPKQRGRPKGSKPRATDAQIQQQSAKAHRQQVEAYQSLIRQQPIWQAKVAAIVTGQIPRQSWGGCDWFIDYALKIDDLVSQHLSIRDCEAFREALSAVAKAEGWRLFCCPRTAEITTAFVRADFSIDLEQEFPLPPLGVVEAERQKRKQEQLAVVQQVDFL